MSELTEHEVEALTTIKRTEGGQVLMKHLVNLLRQDTVDLVRVPPAETGDVGRIQGALFRTQMLLHALGAEYDPADEEGEQEN